MEYAKTDRFEKGHFYPDCFWDWFQSLAKAGLLLWNKSQTSKVWGVYWKDNNNPILLLKRKSWMGMHETEPTWSKPNWHYRSFWKHLSLSQMLFDLLFVFCGIFDTHQLIAAFHSWGMITWMSLWALGRPNDLKCLLHPARPFHPAAASSAGLWIWFRSQKKHPLSTSLPWHQKSRGVPVWKFEELWEFSTVLQNHRDFIGELKMVGEKCLLVRSNAWEACETDWSFPLEGRERAWIRRWAGLGLCRFFLGVSEHDLCSWCPARRRPWVEMHFLTFSLVE